MSLWRLLLWVCPVVLTGAGLIALYSATRHAGSGLRASFDSQQVYCVVALGLAFITCRLRADFWKVLAPWAWLGSVAMLGWVLVDGAIINNARSWIRIGGLSIQPAELLKITLVLALARLLQHGRRDHPLQELLLVVALAAIPLALILRQPDLGSALSLLPVVLAVCHAAGYGLPRLGMIMAFGSLGLLALMMAPAWDLDILPLHTYQVARILRLVHQDGFSPLAALGRLELLHLAAGTVTLALLILWRARSWRRLVWIGLLLAHALPVALWVRQDPVEREVRMTKVLNPAGYSIGQEEPQLLQAKFALGNGGRLGQGFLQGEQTQYQRLPYSYSDLIFASFAEEWGLAGASALLAVWMLFVVSCFRLASSVPDNFSALCLVGLSAMLASQVLIHVGYTVGLLPMTGITMPFMSAGGSSLVVAWTAIAIAHGCTHRAS